MLWIEIIQNIQYYIISLINCIPKILSAKIGVTYLRRCTVKSWPHNSLVVDPTLKDHTNKTKIYNNSLKKTGKCIKQQKVQLRII